MLISHDGRTIAAEVMLCSPNGRSLMLAFDGMFCGFVCMMAVLWDVKADRYFTLMGDCIELCRERVQ